MIKKQDFVLLFILFLLAALLWILPLEGGAPTQCEVSVGGVVVDRFALPADLDYSLAPYGVHANLKVRGSVVCMSDSDCPDKLCVKMGEKSHGGESIVCLPNLVVIRLLGGKAPSVDIVAG